jgi:sugar phosphate isomerase/epimerase
MKIGIMEGFQMHNSHIMYGLNTDGDRIKLLKEAKRLGFNGVELGLGLDYREDPLWKGNHNLSQAIKRGVKDTGVEVASICLHLLNYIEKSPISEDTLQRQMGIEIIMRTIDICHQIDAKVILVPFFGTAKIKNEIQIETLISEIANLSLEAEEKGVYLGLETSIEAKKMVDIIDSIGSKYVKVYFDTGNTASASNNIIQEIEILQEKIIQVHVKDYPLGNLGEGELDFSNILGSLVETGFDGYIVLETPSFKNSSMEALSNLNYLKSRL